MEDGSWELEVGSWELGDFFKTIKTLRHIKT